jgi:N4-gp56 family major capsid protein
MHTWTYDAPTGTYKNHNMSSKIREAAVAEAKFVSYADPEDGYGKGKGESVTITRVSNIAEPTSAVLTENIPIPEDTFSISTVQITVSEWGRSVPFTSLSKDLASFDLQNKIQSKLKDQMKLTMDKACATAFKTAKVKAALNGATSIVFTTNGATVTTSTVNGAMYHVEQIRDYMKTTLHVPPYKDDMYICLASTKFLRGIKSDSKWEQWKIYRTPEVKERGEVGAIEGVIFVEVTNTNCLSGSLGSAGVMGEAVFFGADAVAMAVAEDPELRVAIPKDYGRSQGVAWYGILAFGIIWDTANDGEARIVHVTSA